MSTSSIQSPRDPREKGRVLSPAVNSQTWWNWYFAEHWEANGGGEQTRYFMELLVAHLPRKERLLLEIGGRSVLDWGCAFGEGVDTLARCFPECQVAGLDFAEEAVREARRRFPDHVFLWTQDGDIPHQLDVIVTSNCLEHFEDPLAVLRRQLPFCKELHVTLVPYREEPLCEYHRARFDEGSFPEVVDGFRRVATTVVETDPRHWPGAQILIVYASPDYLRKRSAGTEQEKWDSYYAALPLMEEDAGLAGFNRDFARIVSDLLPEGSRTLEAGCGAGWQSLALARTGRFHADLMDFSLEALRYARDLFRQEGRDAGLHWGDVMQTGSPEHDLVFNAGVLEHYTFAEQVTFLESMASRSRDLVLVLVPNRLCYWYWIWRIEEVARGDWPYGKEVPEVDLSKAFEAAGLRFLGQTFLGETWAEAFIRQVPGISEEMRQRILEVHRSPVLPLAERAYLVAALGTVRRERPRVPEIWRAAPFSERLDQAEAFAVLSDILALRLGAERRLRESGERIEELSRELRRVESERKAGDAESAELQAEARAVAAARERVEESLGALARERDGLASEIALREASFSAELERAEAEREKLEAGHGAERERLEADLAVLRQEREALAVERDRLAGEREHYAVMLARVTQSRAGRLLALHWRLQKGLRATLGTMVRAVYRTVVPRRLREQLYRARGGPGAAPLRSWYAFCFERYRRAREEVHGRDLSGIRTPAVPGLVSIVLPVYNGEDLVREALDSILAQTYPHFELIAIDDGSRDGTGAILDEYAARDPRVRVVHQENRKIPRTLSRGFRMARGEYLTWTSADNRLKPDFLARMVACLERRPAWDMIYANMDIIGDDGEPLRNSAWYGGYQVPDGSEHVHLPHDIADLCVWPNNYVGAAFLYRSRVAWLLGDYSPFRFTTEDYDYWMRVNDLLTLRHADFDDPVYEYRFHSDSLTARDEELGITRGRVKLMVFEEFRRDFHLTPMLWHVESDPDPRARRVAALLEDRIAGAGHVLFEPGAYDPVLMPRLWLPAVHVRIAADPAEAEADLPSSLPGALRVLATLDTPVPGPVSPQWDLCVAVGGGGDLPRLDDGYRGWVAVDESVLFTALDVRARSEHLRRIENEIEAPRRERSCEVSVIICTYRRSERLARAVASVAAQTLPPDRYELIVVDNDPANAGLVQQIEELRASCFGDRPERLRLVLCPLLGLSHARNAGISEARGEVLCFLDDDAVARADWLEQVARAFEEHPETGVIGGHIRLHVPEPRPEVLRQGWERYWSQFLTGHDGYTEVQHWWEFPWGANWCARRKALLEIGGFRSRYGRRAKDFSGGEEIMAASLIQRLGSRIAVLPQAEVLHDVEPDRFTFEHIRHTIIAGTLVSYRAQTDLYLPMEAELSRTVRLFLQPAEDPTAKAAGGLTRLRYRLYQREAWLLQILSQIRDLRQRLKPPAIQES